jgi:hypothetical protein
VHPPCTSEPRLLAAWERSLGQPPTRQAIELLAAGWPDLPEADLARLSIGRRDALLLALRERCFGPEVTATAGCPACAEPLELAFGVGDIRVTPAADPAPAAPLEVRTRGYRVRFRLPDSRDLLDEVDGRSPEAIRERLLERCLLSAAHRGRPAAALPSELVDRIEARMAEADPQADVRFSLACPACGHRWEAPFDIAAFLWSEVDAWANRLLREVHVLASAYGWRETDVLDLGPRRRRFYLAAVMG